LYRNTDKFIQWHPEIHGGHVIKKLWTFPDGDKDIIGPQKNDIAFGCASGKGVINACLFTYSFLRQCIQGFWGTVYNHILSLLVSTMC
jgi:hypothetical protein